MDLSIGFMFLVLNILFFSLVIFVSSCDLHCQSPPTPKPPSTSTETCPRDALKLRGWANVLNDFLTFNLGQLPLRKRVVVTSFVVWLTLRLLLASVVQSRLTFWGSNSTFWCQ